MVLSHIKNQETKLKYVSLWVGKEARTYLSTVSEDDKDSLKTMLDTLEDWTKPKSDDIAAFTHPRALNQDNKTLIYIHSRSEESGRSVQFCMCGRLQGQANQKFYCDGSLKHKSISTMYFKGMQSQSK